MNREPVWVRDDVVLAINRFQIAEHGGIHGVRDAGLLQSALSRPVNLYHYSDPAPSIARLGASYAYGIARNHAFLDGNKRTALHVCWVFLEQNGFTLTASSDDIYHTFIKMAAGNMPEGDFAVWISDHIAQFAVQP